MRNICSDMSKCTGCGACVDICAHNAIKMQTDSCGFKYPTIDADKCKECKLCQRICDNRVKREIESFQKQIYAAWSTDVYTRITSTSGGIFSELAKIIVCRGGVAVGAQYSNKLLVEHSLVCDQAGIERIKQSKYLQSDTAGIYKSVKTQLKTGREVLFCGTPCQVAALKAYLCCAYNNLITVDFICRGVNSPKAYEAWLNEIQSTEGKKAVRVWFKYKVNGWKSSPQCTRVDFVDGSYRVYDKEENLFMNGYLGPNLYIRPSCGDCDFKGIQRQSDITLADFWSVGSNLDDDNGTSMVLVNTPNGKRLFEEIKSHINWEVQDIETVKQGNVCCDFSVKVSPKSKAFLTSLDNMKFSEALSKYTKQSVVEKNLLLIKRALSKAKRMILNKVWRNE